VVDAVQFRILGPVSVEVYKEPVKVQRRRERHLLALLLLDVGRPVPAHRLIDLMWPQERPANARAALQTSLSRLRATLGDVEGTRLVRRGDGYAIETEPEAVDAHRFRRLLADANRADDPATRADLARRALSLWRGPALADVGDTATRSATCAGLDAMRDQALALRIRADLDLGRHEAVIGELADLVAADPLNEPAVANLVLALYRAGRRGEALAAFQRAKTQLAEQLGMDPGAELQRLELAVLRDDPALTGPTSSAAARPVPAQLPASIPVFVGRRQQLAELDARLAADPGTSRATAVRIVTIVGAPGVGKTALALHWAHRVRDRFRDGQLYVNLRGFDPVGPAVSPTQAVQGFLSALGVPPERLPAGLDDQTALYRSLLADRPTLVVLDNALDAEQVRPLLPGAPGSAVVVTSRDALPGLIAVDGAKPLVLDVPPIEDAREMFVARVGGRRCVTEPEAVYGIAERCGRLPLAIAVAAAGAATRPGRSLASFADELAEPEGSRLDALTGRDPASDVRRVFATSYQLLSEPTARLFRLLGLHPGEYIRVAAAASLLGVGQKAVRPLLAELVQAHLLSELTSGTYACHDLLRAYAVELLDRLDPAAERHAARSRLVEHYVRTADAAAAVLRPVRDRVPPVLVETAVTAETFADEAAARGWLTADHRIMINLIEAGATDSQAWQLASVLEDLLEPRGQWQDIAAIQRAALHAAEARADRPAQAHAHRAIARARVQLGEDEVAQRHFRRAIEIFEDIDDTAGRARTHHNLAGLYERQGRYDAALEQAQRAYELAGEVGHRAGQAHSLGAIAWFRCLLGDYAQAILDGERAVAAHRDVGDRFGQAASMHTIGYAQHRLGRNGDAVVRYREAVAIFSEIGARGYEANALCDLGDAVERTGDRPAALKAWQNALDIYEQLDHPATADLRRRLNRG
jgi:DNA-binding SARP family transcriptional activator/Tfp pilus assembly protein PilF